MTDSLAGEVVHTGKPLRASRESEDEPIKIKTGYFVEALLYAPLVQGGVTFGVLAAAHREPNKEFSELDERLLVTVADFAAIAIQNARLHGATDRALARRVEELAAINELSRAATATLNLDKVHDVLIEQVRKRWDVETAALWLIDEEEGTATPYAGAEKDSDDISRRAVKLGQDIIGEVARTGQSKTYHGSVDGEKLETDSTLKMRAKTIACVPLKSHDRVIGVLALINKRKGLFSNDDVARLEAFGNTMATAIDNARLYAQSEWERTLILALANALPQPIMMVGKKGEGILSNKAAEELLESTLHAESPEGRGPLGQLLQGLSQGLGRTTDVTVGDKTFLTSIEHSPEVGTITVMQDITHERKLERAQAEFIDALTHDLRSPLASIKGFAQAMGRISELEDRASLILDRIVQASNSMLDMLNQLLDVALLTRSPRTDRRPCDLSIVVTSAVHDLEGAAMAKSIDLDVELKGEPYKIMGHSKHLYRSTLNLVSNAIKFTPESGKVTISVTYTDEDVTIEVRDTGPGISKEDLPQIFERFYTGEQGTGAEPGFGLGLAIVRSTAEAHAGEVSARNAGGGGAVFVLTLPATLRVR